VKQGPHVIGDTFVCFDPYSRLPFQQCFDARVLPVGLGDNQAVIVSVRFYDVLIEGQRRLHVIILRRGFRPEYVTPTSHVDNKRLRINVITARSANQVAEKVGKRSAFQSLVNVSLKNRSAISVEDDRILKALGLIEEVTLDRFQAVVILGACKVKLSTRE
jgi:hypothetical protein